MNGGKKKRFNKLTLLDTRLRVYKNVEGDQKMGKGKELARQDKEFPKETTLAPIYHK